MIPVLLATVIAVYGLWYGLFAKEVKAVHPWTVRTKYRYKPNAYQPNAYQRFLVVAGSLAILIAGVTEALRMWKSH